MTKFISKNYHTKIYMKGGDATHCIVLDKELLAMYLAYTGGNK